MALFTSARERRLWLLALAVIAAIYATLGRVPLVARLLRDRALLDTTFFTAFFIVVVAAAVVGLSRRPGWQEVATGVIVMAAYTMSFLRFGITEERTHLAEYGVVALLVYLALLERRARGGRVPAPAVVAFGVVAALGWIDEGIQAALPNRVYDLRDVGFNALAAFMAITSVGALRWARRRGQSR